ncbi:MAG: Yip1 family protein [Methanoregula sp.]|nr:Yip1 family protein [Methanoregula sp.]
MLFSPDVFFTEITKEKENIIWPFIIAMLGGIGMIVSSVFHTVSYHPDSLDSALKIFLFSISFQYVFVVPLLMWAVVSVTIYAVSKVFSGTGSLIATFRNTGYGMLPMNLYGLGFYLLATGAFIAFGEIPGYTDNPVSRMMNVLNVIGLAFVFWSGYLWVVGTEKSCNLPRKTAMIPVACAVLLGCVVTLLWFTY